MDAHHAPELERKLLSRPFSVQASDAEGSFEGFGAVFDELHATSSWTLPAEWKDRIRPGAFARTLADHAAAGTLPAMLYMHERGNVVGAWRELKEDGAGLRAKGQIALSARAPNGASLHELMKLGGLTGLSVGFRVRKAALDQERKVRDILDVQLGELSVVDLPGIHSARVTDVKSRDPKNVRYLETVLREAGLSRDEAKALLARGFGALREAATEDDGTGAHAVQSAARELLAGLRSVTAALKP